MIFTRELLNNFGGKYLFDRVSEYVTILYRHLRGNHQIRSLSGELIYDGIVPFRHIVFTCCMFSHSFRMIINFTNIIFFITLTVKLSTKTNVPKFPLVR